MNMNKDNIKLKKKKTLILFYSISKNSLNEALIVKTYLYYRDLSKT